MTSPENQTNETPSKLERHITLGLNVTSTTVKGHLNVLSEGINAFEDVARTEGKTHLSAANPLLEAAAVGWQAYLRGLSNLAADVRSVLHDARKDELAREKAETTTDSHTANVAEPEA